MLSANFEAFILDDEIPRIEASDENLSFDAIRAAIFGDRHFLVSNQTFGATERDYKYPTLADREQFHTWPEAGAQDPWTHAKIHPTDIIPTHKPTYLTPSQDAEICVSFSILA